MKAFFKDRLEVFGFILLSLPYRFEGLLVPASDLPLRTHGRNLVTSTEPWRQVRLECVNWYGSQMKDMVPNGLNIQPLTKVVKAIVDFGFNCVRLPFSLEMVFTNRTEVPRPAVTLKANPELQQLSPLEVFHRTVQSLADVGLLVILNNHNSKAGWCCGENDGDGLWYTMEYPEEAWLGALGSLAAQYVDNPMVVGIELRNELRGAHGFLPTWGSGDPATDWAAAAERGGRRVLQANPDMLVFVSGLHFSVILQCVPNQPLHEMEGFRGRLVYVAHDYYWYHFGIRYHQMLSEPCRLAPRVAGIICTLALLSFLLPIPSRLLFGRVIFWERLLLGFFTGLALASLTLTFFFHRSCAIRDHVMHDVALLLVRLLAAPIFLFSGRQLLLCTIAGWPSLLSCDGSCARPKLSEKSSTEPLMTIEVHSIGDGANDEGNDEPKVSLRSRFYVEVVMCRLGQWIIAFLASWQFALILSAICTVIVLRHEAAAFLDYEFYESEWDRRWGFLLEGYGTSEAPVWLSEFGTAQDSNWWRHLLRYIRENNVDFAYWALNGEKKALSFEEPYGLFNKDWKTVRHMWKLDALQRLGNTSSPY